MESYQTVSAGRVFGVLRSPYNRACDGASEVGHVGDGRAPGKVGTQEEGSQTQTGHLGQCLACSRALDCSALVSAREGRGSRTSHRELDWRRPQCLPRLVDVEAWLRWRWYSWVCGVVIMGRASCLLSV